jgi:serine/threonine protein kinase
MNPDLSFAEVEDLFHRALEVPTAERAAFIQRSTERNPALGHEVLSLVQAVDTADRLREQRGSRNVESPAAHAKSAIGLRLGVFQLDRLLGSGGMGDVYAGRRIDGGLEQFVAVKLISARLDSAQLRAAFFRERDTLARLQHPHIARLLDGGLTADNAPYLVMEIVGDEASPAERLDTYCQQRNLSLRERILLIAQVCDAVAYAHGKLIVHGDLKPANVLVSVDGHAKLLDFGAARLLSGEDADSRLHACTPAYASPEQMRGSPITVSSDIYSMGKLLERALGAPTDPELVAAIAKATHAEPKDRYVSVEQLAGDLRAWLSHRPLRACLGSRAYVARKWFRRNRGGVTASAVVFAALVASIVLMQRAEHKAISERDHALRAATAVETLAHRLLFDFQPQLRDMGSSTEAQHQLATTTVSYLNELARDPSLASDTLRLDIVNAYTRMGNLLGNPYDENLGQPKEAAATLQKAVAVADELVRQEPSNREALYSLAMAQRGLAEIDFGAGDTEASLTAMLASVKDFEKLVQPNDASREQIMEAANTWGGLGDIYGLPGSAALNRHSEAIDSYRKQIELSQRSLRIDPGYVRARRSAAVGEYKIANLHLDKEPDAAIAGYQRALSYLKDLPSQAQSAAPTVRLYIVIEGHMGRAYAHRCKFAEAIAAITHTRDRSAALVARDPLDNRALDDLQSSQTGLGDVLLAAGNKQGARKSYQEALQTIESMMKRNPTNKVLREHRKDLRETLAQLDRTANRQGAAPQ